MIRRTLFVAALSVGTFASMAPAQSASDPNGTTTSSRSSSRSNRGLIKLGIYGVCGLVAVGGWALKKMKGE